MQGLKFKTMHQNLVQMNSYIKSNIKKNLLKKIKKTNLKMKDYQPLNWTSLYLDARDQGQCGGCWAFSTAGLIEGFISKHTGVQNYFSPQQLINCDSSDAGCNGGWFQTSLTFVEASGVALEASNPYNATQLACDATVPRFPGNLFTEFNFCSNFTDTYCTEDIVYQFLTNGPVSVGMDGGTQDIMNYAGGIFTGECSAINHAVLLVGYGFDSSTNLDFWIIRNSWSVNWGENGYLRVARNSTNNGSCFITHSAYSLS